MRYLFYGMIILTVVLALILLGQVIYWGSRIFVCKHTAAVIHWSVVGGIALIVAVAALWGNLVTRFRLDINQVEVASERVPQAFDGYRIAQISDLHLDWFDSEKGHEFLNSMIDSIGAQHPDIIVFTGDLVTIQSSEAEPFRQELAKLGALDIPVYSILGNHDYADYTRKNARQKYEDVEHLCQLQREAGWHLLRNESVQLTRDSVCVNLIGVENIGEPPFSTYGDLKKAMATDVATAFSILLSHNPTHWRREVLPDTDIDLMLAGHTHAVQVKIGNWSPAKWKYPEWGGLYAATEKDNPQYLYVNTGMGGVGPRVRIGVAPEITILTLRHRE